MLVQQLPEDISYEEQESYYPRELVLNWPSHIEEIYHCYTIEMQQNFDDDVSFENIILAVKSNLGNDFTHMDFKLFANKGSVGVNVVYAGTILLSPERVSVATKFQVALLRSLINQKWNRSADALDKHQQNDTVPRISYLLLPSTNADGKSPNIHWDCISSLFTLNCHRSHCPEKSCLNYVHTKDKEICRGMLMNSLVVTPHNGYVYCISGFLDGLDGNSVMKSKGEAHRYKEYYKSK
ncbi:hypothetical protein IFM89_030628 [Coptis chinensis]|uniref:PAZ domain-containing protein n=1 Tax=Coptis chinensis TaxID=261450 RepID=A0A835LPL3_9MAGN|nr:hypothetical protein IFM89_030628 [Coptis chinensis]